MAGQNERRLDSEIRPGIPEFRRHAREDIRRGAHPSGHLADPGCVRISSPGVFFLLADQDHVACVALQIGIQGDLLPGRLRRGQLCRPPFDHDDLLRVGRDGDHRLRDHAKMGWCRSDDGPPGVHDPGSCWNSPRERSLAVASGPRSLRRRKCPSGRIDRCPERSGTDRSRCLRRVSSERGERTVLE